MRYFSDCETIVDSMIEKKQYLEISLVWPAFYDSFLLWPLFSLVIKWQLFWLKWLRFSLKPRHFSLFNFEWKILSFDGYLMTRKSVPMIQDLKTKLKAILENSIISSAKRIGRPIFVNLPTYYVRFSSDHAQPEIS